MNKTAIAQNGEDAISPRRSAEWLPAATGFFLALRTATVLLSARAFGLDPELGSAINAALEFLLLGVVAFCTMGDRQPGQIRLGEMPPARWVIAFLAFSCCSLLWSATVSLADSSVYWCALASDVITVSLLLETRSFDHAADSLLEGYVWGACVLAAIAWIMPAQPDLRLGDDELLGPNTIAYVCALAFFFAQYLLRERQRSLMLAATLLSVTVLRSLSKTTIAAFVVSEGFLLLRDRSIRGRKKVLILLAAAVVFTLFSSLLASYYDIYTSTGNQSETLTGRLGIWAYFLAEAVRQPWLGHGFDSAWKVIPPFGADQFLASQAHNELLQQFYAYGSVGLVLFFGIYGSLWLQIRRVPWGRQRTFFTALLLFVLVRGLADTDRFDLSLPLWAVVSVAWLAEKACADSKKMLAEGSQRALPVPENWRNGARGAQPGAQMSSDCNFWG
ncbi:MAG TPA: O-antigen ligase family protein [Acidobacteriaceae bacterium]|jgi:O-antigen ligase|nr:O-antigen ligase family protein [Acidobacteriaceae bacterium]